MDAIKVFKPDSEEYKKLTEFADKLKAKLNNDLYFTVETLYFDYGAKLLWTTIIAHNPNETGVLSSWQALSPANQEIILTGTDERREELLEKLAVKYKEA